MTKKWKAPYSIRTVKRETGPNTWAYNDIEIVGPNDDIVGKYTYNYSGKPPFFPFYLQEQWYALYAKDYTASRIMKLPNCDDVWGEERNSYGFCPVEFYVPSVQNTDFGGDRTGKLGGSYDTDPNNFEEPHHNEEYNWTVKPVKFMDFGFVCGCMWGDDSSWKIRFFDLSRIVEGIVTYDERFGYAEMHNKLSLQESVEVIWPGSSHDKIGIRLYTAKDYNFDGTTLRRGRDD